VTLRAADRMRPHLAAPGPVELALEPGAKVVLDGLLVSSASVVVADTAGDRPKTVVLRHCTLVPGLRRTAAGEAAQPAAVSLQVLDPFAEVRIERSIVGRIVAVEGATVTVVDSILDASTMDGIVYSGQADRPGGPLTITASTVVGRVDAERVDISDALIVAKGPAPLRARRRQVGCVRFSLLPAGAQVPTPYRCPVASPEVAPHFAALRYGHPEYAQLRPTTPAAIRAGASDGGELGVTHHLDQPQREANLRLRLDEYLRFGLEAGIGFAEMT